MHLTSVAQHLYTRIYDEVGRLIFKATLLRAFLLRAFLFKTYIGTQSFFASDLFVFLLFTVCHYIGARSALLAPPSDAQSTGPDFGLPLDRVSLMVRRVKIGMKAPRFSRVSAAAVCDARCAVIAACRQAVWLLEMFERTPSSFQ